MTRTMSQNVTFDRHVAEEEDAWPLGEPLLRGLLEAMRAGGLTIGEPDTERDGCWSVRVTVGEAVLQLDLAPGPGERDRWYVQISVRDQPGLIGRLFRKPVVDRSAEMLQVAEALDRALRGADATRLRWLVDGPPGEHDGTEHPTLARG